MTLSILAGHSKMIPVAQIAEQDLLRKELQGFLDAQIIHCANTPPLYAQNVGQSPSPESMSMGQQGFAAQTKTVTVGSLVALNAKVELLYKKRGSTECFSVVIPTRGVVIPTSRAERGDAS